MRNLRHTNIHVWMHFFSLPWHLSAWLWWLQLDKSLKPIKSLNYSHLVRVIWSETQMDSWSWCVSVCVRAGVSEMARSCSHCNWQVVCVTAEVKWHHWHERSRCKWHRTLRKSAGTFCPERPSYPRAAGQNIIKNCMASAHESFYHLQYISH